jgi:hypothetical protein
MTDVPARWYADPTGRHDHRYWDGAKWTHHIADLGVAGTEAYVGPPNPPEPEPEEPEALEPEALESDAPTAAETEVAAAPTTPWATAPDETTDEPTASPIATSNSSRRLIVLIAVAAILAIIVVIVLLATGGNDDGARSTAGKALSAQLAGRLRSANGFTPDDAECVSSYMVDHLGTDRLRGVDLTGEQVPAALQSDFAKALGDGVVKCKVSAPNLSTDGSSPLSADPQDQATTKQLFVNFYEVTLGLDPTKAQCLADQMFAKLNAGKTSLSNASEQLPDALKACKIPADVLQRLARS